jgi:peptidoglycan/xylan/chitin deacetylase (PgdA/CDA1 family)
LNGDGRWQRLRVELDRWRDAGRIADFWLRDDDAVAPTAPLDRLLGIAGGFGVPAALAVIPARAGEALAGRLSAEPGVSVAVHGWAHVNHAPPDRKKEELGAHRPMRTVLAELAMARAAIDRLFGERALPLLVPPWNRIAADLLPQLAGIGFAALSVYGRAGPAPVRLVNTHVDLIDWHGSRGGRDHGELVAALVEELRWRRRTGGREPVGVLAHHLVHDEAAWSFLERLFEVTAGNAGCRWAAVRELI